MHAPHAQQVDPVGTWRHSPDATWTITAMGEGNYQAQEAGLGNASGVAHFTASGLFHIDYVTRDGTIAGIYEVRFARDGRSATGNVRELTGPRRTGTTSWARVVATPPPPPQPAPPPPQPAPTAYIDPTGTWRHSPEATWTITPVGGGRYQAQETGLGNAAGPAYFTQSGTFRIEYLTRDRTISGVYEVRFSPDGRTAAGSVQELTGPRRSGGTNWTRVVATPPAQPVYFDPTGTWRHHPQATWTITRAADGRFYAQETGLGNAAGPAYFTQAGTFRIDYVTRDRTISGYYEVRFSPDGRSATGTVQELNGPKRSGPTNWSR
jgi:hypothetical protein